MTSAGNSALPCPRPLAEWAEQQSFSVEIWDAEGRCVFVNDAWRKLWRMPDRVLVASDYRILTDKALLAKPVWQLLRQGFSGAYSVATDTPPTLYNPREDGRPGRLRWTEGRVVPLWTGSDSQDASGPAYTVILLHDVTRLVLGRRKLGSVSVELQDMFWKEVRTGSKLIPPQARHARPVGNIPPEVAVLRAPAPEFAALSPEERRAVAMLARGYIVKSAAALLEKSEKTLYVQLTSARQKLGLSSNEELTVYACRWAESFSP